MFSYMMQKDGNDKFDCLFVKGTWTKVLDIKDETEFVSYLIRTSYSVLHGMGYFNMELKL